MAETSSLKPLKATLETIRERADYALKQLQKSEEQRLMRWKCANCGYTKRFTRPVPQETADDCPKCKSRLFEVGP
jgi:predicted Zn-ribbon and HTH transcriptional regulator